MPSCNECAYNAGGTGCRKTGKHLELGQDACAEFFGL